MNLSSTQKLQIVLTAAKTTNDMPVVVSCVDTSTEYFPDYNTFTINTNGITVVDILGSPIAGNNRKVNYVSVVNTDTATKTVQIYLDNNGTDFLLQSCELSVGDSLIGTDTEGWYVLDKHGSKKKASIKIPKRLGQGAIAVSPGTLLYTVPTSTITTVKDMDIANTTAAALTCLVYFVPSGGSPAAANTVIPNVSIPANTVVKWSGEQILVAGDFIQAIGSAAGITITVSGEEQT
jgi:hypothetical protein